VRAAGCRTSQAASRKLASTNAPRAHLDIMEEPLEASADIIR
jgi:hypothetical protein